MVKVKEKYFKIKHRPTSILLNVTINFKFKLQLKFINNKNPSYITVNLHTSLYTEKTSTSN